MLPRLVPLLAAAALLAAVVPTVRAQRIPAVVIRARQILVVTTPGWDSTSGWLRRFSRSGPASRWQPVGEPIPIVVGRAGLGWGADYRALARDAAPVKHEGDGRSPAGAFPLGTTFGFAPRDSMAWVRMPYLPLASTTDCVDDTTSSHYNRLVDRAAVGRVDWASAEHMRTIDQYEIGVVVDYNAAPPRPGAGSCIFLHIWGGPGSTTTGCTAMPRDRLETVVRWLDRARHPALVQMPAEEYDRLRARWRLPAR